MELTNGNKPDSQSIVSESEKNHFHSVLLDIKRLDKTDLNDFLKKVLSVVSDAIDVERVSIWFYNEDRRSIYCNYLYTKTGQEFKKEVTLSIENFPNYFKAIESQLYVGASDAENDPQTKELAELYLKPRKIYSIMDVPIHYKGQTIGIICHEELDGPRRWKREEVDFVAAISSLVSTAMEIDFRKKKEQDFEESQRFLATLISNLPGYVYRVTKAGKDWSIQYISEGVHDLTGYTPKELLRDGDLYYGMMVDESDKKTAKKIVNEALAEKKPYQINYRINTSNGTIKWVWEQGQGVYSESGELIATEGFVTDITEKKIFEEEIIKRNFELYVLNQIGQSLSMLAEPAKIVKDVSEMLGNLFSLDNLYIALYDEARNYISFPYYTVEGKSEPTEGRKFENGLTEYIINTKKPLMVNSAKDELFRKIGVAQIGKNALSILSAPMIAGEKVLGVITMQDYSHENAFDNSQLELLTTIATQAAIALENSTLYNAVTKSLREKEVLLQEVHHRVKNNLQIMSSLVKLQSHYVNDPKMLEILKETESRIHSMAIVHSKLYMTKDYEKINFYDYVKNLTDNFWNTYGFKLKNVAIKIKISDFYLNIDTAIPCGLIINELVLNSIKYAFPNNEKGEIVIELLNQSSERLTLSVKDNGIGLPEGMNVHESDTLGIQLVTLLSKQMNGHIKINSQKNKGTEFIIDFEEAVYKARR